MAIKKCGMGHRLRGGKEQKIKKENSILETLRKTTLQFFKSNQNSHLLP